MKKFNERDYFNLAGNLFAVITTYNVYVKCWEDFPILFKELVNSDEKILEVLYGSEQDVEDIFLILSSTKDNYTKLVKEIREIPWSSTRFAKYYKNK